MESKALQELVRSIFSNEKSREEFRADPKSYISRYALTGTEKKALMNIHSRLDLVTEDSKQLHLEMARENWLAAPPVVSRILS